MKLSAYTFITIFLFIVACGDNKSDITRPNTDSLHFITNAIINKFTLPYDINLSTDTSSLIFYYTKSFDTSFLIHIHPIKGEIIGTYYETLPKFHRDLEGYSDSGMKFLFFQGFSFVVDKNIWDSIKNNAENVFNKDSSITSKVCFDCDSYFLYYNHRTRYDNRLNEVEFKSFCDYLKTTVIDKINEVRRGFK